MSETEIFQSGILRAARQPKVLLAVLAWYELTSVSRQLTCSDKRNGATRTLSFTFLFSFIFHEFQLESCQMEFT